jgi:arsenical pump membrane protein
VSGSAPTPLGADPSDTDPSGPVRPGGPPAAPGQGHGIPPERDPPAGTEPAALPGRLTWPVAGAGVLLAVAAAGAEPAAARGAAAQVWSPFVLVAGLLLVGMVAADDGVFRAAGRRLERLATSTAVLYVGSMALVAVVTAVLNLDTSVTFLTPVLVEAGRRRRDRSGAGPGPALLYGCLLMSNAASLLLPGSNLTNLIVLGHLRLSGGEFAARMAPAWVAVVVITAAVVAVVHRQGLGTRTGHHRPSRAVGRSRAGAGPGTAPVQSGGAPVQSGGAPVHTRRLGLAAVVSATALVVVLRSPALPVLGVGVAAGLLDLARRGEEPAGRPRPWRRPWQALGVPALVGLFGIAVGAGTVGRAWSGPAWLVAHAGSWAGAGVSAVLCVVMNNLPAAALLAARHPPHPLSVLVGLDLGPNLAVTGSLSALLWWRAARRAGARPTIKEVSRLGIVSVPLSMAGALALLAVTGSH